LIALATIDDVHIKLALLSKTPFHKLCNQKDKGILQTRLGTSKLVPQSLGRGKKTPHLGTDIFHVDCKGKCVFGGFWGSLFGQRRDLIGLDHSGFRLA